MAKKRYAKKKKTTGKRKKSVKSGSISVKALWPYLAGVVLITLIGMFPVVNADFTEIDDQELIIKSTEKSAHNPMRIWRQGLYTPHYKPLVRLTWLIEQATFGMNARALHINNLLLHIINVILVFLLALRVSQFFESTRKSPELVAAATAAIFGVHPLHVESVAWAIERKDVLYTMFFLLGLLSYVRYMRSSDFKWMLLAALSFLASIMSKAPSIMFPFVCFVSITQRVGLWARKFSLKSG